jgi:hypothetical protein
VDRLISIRLMVLKIVFCFVVLSFTQRFPRGSLDVIDDKLVFKFV